MSNICIVPFIDCILHIGAYVDGYGHFYLLCCILITPTTVKQKYQYRHRPSKNIANGIDPENNNHLPNAIHTEIFNSFT